MKEMHFKPSPKSPPIKTQSGVAFQVNLRFGNASFLWGHVIYKLDEIHKFPQRKKNIYIYVLGVNCSVLIDTVGMFANAVVDYRRTKMHSMFSILVSPYCHITEAKY